MSRARKNCRCGPFDCFGWTGSLLNPSAGTSDPRWAQLQARKVPPVLARFIHDNGPIPAGTIPPAMDPNWEVNLETSRELWEHEYGFSLGSKVWTLLINGTRVFKHGSRWFVAYIFANANVDVPIGEDVSLPSFLQIIDIETQEVVHTQYLSTIDPAIGGPSGFWYAQYQGTWGGGGAQPVYPPQLNGITRNSWVIHGSFNRFSEPNGFAGSGFVQRHIFDTGESAIALGVHPIDSPDFRIIQLPAMAADDGLPWCLAQSNEPYELWTGPWLNDSVGDLTDPTSTNAQLIGDELVNRIDDKPGFPDLESEFWEGGVRALAYTRMHGYDYVLMQGQVGTQRRIYYDGRREEWFEVDESSGTTFGNYPHNIYSFEDGQVVLASSRHVELIDRDNPDNSWVFETGNTAFNDLGPVISGNGKWVHVGNLIGLTSSAFTKSTADLEAFGTELFEGQIDHPFRIERCYNWSLSRKKVGEGPIVVPHREYDWKLSCRIDDPYTAESSYINRIYCGNTDLINKHYMAGDGGNGISPTPLGRWAAVNFEAVPGCECCRGAPDDKAEGF